MNRAVIFPSLVAITFLMVMVMAWFVLAIAAHAVKADPLCGRACYDPGFGENPNITQMHGGQ
jgi:hypothetical protein